MSFGSQRVLDMPHRIWECISRSWLGQFTVDMHAPVRADSAAIHLGFGDGPDHKSLKRSRSDRVFGSRVKWLGHRAGVALIMALSAPMLVATTGMAVDIGYWYQEQENLQSAADAAALAAAQAEVNYPGSVTTTANAEPFAVAAALNATNNHYPLTSTTGTTPCTYCVTVVPTGSSPTLWTATVTAPRTGFFSGVRGMGLTGLAAGNQTALAVAAYRVGAPATACLDTTSTSGTDISVSSSGGELNGSGCGVFANSATCSGANSAISASNGVIVGQTVSVASGGCASESNASGSFVGTTADQSGATFSANGSGVTTGTQNDLEPDMDPGTTSSTSDLTWPTIPNPPTAPSLPSGGTLSGSGNVDAAVGESYTLNNLGNGALAIGTTALNTSTLASSGITEITNGIVAQNGVGVVTFGGSEVFISGSVTLDLSSSLSTAGGTTEIGSATIATPDPYVFDNSLMFMNGNSSRTISLGQGAYYFESSVAFSGEKVTTASGSDFYFNGSVSPGNNETFNYGTGLYMFSHGYSTSNVGTYVFSGGTYFFNGGLQLSQDGDSEFFGPGIYYINNGPLVLQGAIASDGATFVLEGTASFSIINNSNGSLNLVAPTTNCVQPSAFPNSNFTGNNPPFDGTDGKGICGVLIYQARNDARQDSILTNTTGNITGIIYAPNAALSLSGSNGAISAQPSTAIDPKTGGNFSGIFEIESSTISDANTGKLTFSSGSSSSSGGASSSPLALLVQ
jgi:Flp pilus assembly protein TadG